MISENAPISLIDTHWRGLSSHPRLFANATRFEELRRQSDPISKQIIGLLRDEAEKALTAETLVYPTEGFILFAVREVQGRILTLSMMYRLTDDRRYFERARAELMHLVNLPEWRPSHFLDAGEAALAAAIGLDWLYEELTPAERHTIAEAIVNNALLPSLRVREGMNGWVDGDFNWNPVCHAGLVVGALAIAEREPELAKRIVNRAIRNVPHAEETYAPQGSYPEGPSYWSYGTSFHVILVEALRSVFGTSYGIGTSPGFLQSADFIHQMVGPTEEEYNFSDYHVENRHEPVMLWFARELRRSDLAKRELLDIACMSDAIGANTKTKNHSRHLALELLWWDSTLTVTNLSLARHWTATGKLPIAVMRSAWENPNATYVAIKGGTPNSSHAHMDIGSFILEANGVRWGLDLGTENYDLMRRAQIDLWNTTQDSSRWSVFRNGPDGHNLLRFNGARQDVEGRGEIRALALEGGAMGNVFDLSSLYHNEVEKLERRVLLHPDQSVTIEDVWVAGGHPVDAAWQWLTRATVTQTEHGLLLEQQGQSLELTIKCPVEIAIDIEDVSQPRAAQDSPNPGLSRIVIRLKTEQYRVGKLLVQVVPGRINPKKCEK